MILVGLGNPGPVHSLTRHNIGFMVLEKLAQELTATNWKEEFGVRQAKVGSHWLIEPYQFMNISGQTLSTYLKKKNIQLEPGQNLLVIHDDLDFPLGEIHEQTNRSAAGHNGVQSVIDAFGTQNFSRLRIGIGSNRDTNIPAETYVLQFFTAEEQPMIDRAVTKAVELLKQKLAG